MTTSPNDSLIRVTGLQKSFTLHTQGGVVIPVFENLDFVLNRGECVVLFGPSGCGKSTFMRALYANYAANGEIAVRHRDRWVDMTNAEPRDIMAVRRWTMGYVSQFLSVIPRVTTTDVVAEPLVARGTPIDQARAKAEALLKRLNIPSRLWGVAPATFSGGEQQRVNLARGFIAKSSIMLLDEPTASLDATNRQVVIDLINEAKNDGAGIVAICHDHDIREAIADRLFHLTPEKRAA